MKNIITAQYPDGLGGIPQKTFDFLPLISDVMAQSTGRRLQRSCCDGDYSKVTE